MNKDCSKFGLIDSHTWNSDCILNTKLIAIVENPTAQKTICSTINVAHAVCMCPLLRMMYMQ